MHGELSMCFLVSILTLWYFLSSLYQLLYWTYSRSARVVQRQRLADAAVVAPKLSAPNMVVARKPVRETAIRARCALMRIPHFLYFIVPLLRLLLAVLLWKSLSHIRIPGKYNHRPGIFDFAKECACRPALYSACYLRLKYLQPAV